MPLRMRLALIFSLVTALASSCAGVIFVAQLRDDLYDTLDTGLRAQYAATYQELASEGRLPSLRPTDEPILVQTLSGVRLDANPSATGWRLSPEVQQSALAGEAFFTTDVGGHRIRGMASKTQLASGTVLLAVGVDTDIADDATERVTTALLVGGPLAVLIIGAGAWLLADAALHPVRRMRLQASSIGEHDSDRRLIVPDTRDEVAALGSTMNRLLDRMHSALDRERRFVGDASHELRTPLAILRTELELAARPGRGIEDLRTAIADAGQETERLTRLTEDLLLLARADNRQTILRLTSVDVGELLATTVTRARAHDRKPTIVVDCPEGLRVVADADKLSQVVDNLLSNAIVHTPPNTPIGLCAAQDEDGVTTIEVIDDGPGLPPEFQPRAFERFHRAEHARSRDSGGTGLGLSIVRAIAEAHRGTADIVNRHEGGARASIRLPARPEPPPVVPSPGQPASAAHDPEPPGRSDGPAQ